MKKRLVAFFLICVMTLSFASPVVANAVVVAEPTNTVVEQEISPFDIVTRIYYRWSPCGCGGLQFRVWNITTGRWLTEWAYVNPPG